MTHRPWFERNNVRLPAWFGMRIVTRSPALRGRGDLAEDISVCPSLLVFCFLLLDGVVRPPCNDLPVRALLYPRRQCPRSPLLHRDPKIPSYDQSVPSTRIQDPLWRIVSNEVRSRVEGERRNSKTVSRVAGPRRGFVLRGSILLFIGNEERYDGA